MGKGEGEWVGKGGEGREKVSEWVGKGEKGRGKGK